MLAQVIPQHWNSEANLKCKDEPKYPQLNPPQKKKKNPQLNHSDIA